MRIQVRRGLAAAWASKIPAVGEPAYATDSKRFAVGDGVTTFPSLPAIGSDTTATRTGFLATNFDPALVASQSLAAPVAGTLYVIKVPLTVNASLSNLYLYVTTAGVGLTANQCLSGIYSAAGVLLQTTGDQSVAWASGGLKTMPITPQAVTGDFFYFAYEQNFVTSAARFHAGNNGVTAVNGILSAANARYATDATNTGLTTVLPATLGTLALSSQSPWCAAA